MSGRKCQRCERGYVMRGRPAEMPLCAWCWEAWAAHRDCHNCKHGIKSDVADEGREVMGESYLCGIWKAIDCRPGKASARWEIQDGGL